MVERDGRSNSSVLLSVLALSSLVVLALSRSCNYYLIQRYAGKVTHSEIERDLGQNYFGSKEYGNPVNQYELGKR